MPVEYFAVGQVLKPQGIKGEIKVKPLTDSPDRFQDFKTVLLKDKDTFKSVNILSRRYMKDWVILLLEGFNSIESAEFLRGQTLWIPRSMARVLPSNNYFIADLIGCNVVSESGNSLGVITEVIKTGSNDVIVVKHEEQEVLIPFLKKIVIQVDIAMKRIVLDTGEFEGLVYNED